MHAGAGDRVRPMADIPVPGTPMQQQPTDSRLRVLVADDDPGARQALADMVGALGHTVVSLAGDGREAVEQSRALAPDVAILDVHMPGRTGIEAAEAMREGDSPVAVVLLSGDLEVSLAQHDPRATNAVAILPKPARLGILDATLRLAASRMRERVSAQREAADAARRLEDRKVIERAKGILMRRIGGSEDEAYRVLRRTSQDRAKPMVEIARQVLASEQRVSQ